MNKTLDPVTLEVIRNALPAISDEMSVDLQRTSYNMMIYEVRDYFSAKYSYLGTNDEGQPDVLIKDEFTNAMMQAAMEGMKRKQLAAARKLLVDAKK